MLFSAPLFAAEGEISFGTAPLNWVNGNSVVAEYRLASDLSVGLESFNAKRSSVTGLDTMYQLTGVKPFARLYGQSTESGWFIGAGLISLSYKVTTTTSTYNARTYRLTTTESTDTGAKTGPTTEAGWQWRWSSFYQEAGMDYWFIGSVSDGLGNDLYTGELYYRLGWYF